MSAMVTCVRCGRRGEREFALGEMGGEYGYRCTNVEACTKRLDRPVVEDAEYTAFMVRVTRAMARRVASNADALSGYRAMQEALDEGKADAISAARAEGLSWAEIGKRAGMTAQGAQQWYARRVSPTSHVA